MLTVKQLKEILDLYPDDAQVFYFKSGTKYVDLVFYVKETEIFKQLVATTTVELAPPEIRSLI
jgi:hypothetical protein